MYSDIADSFKCDESDDDELLKEIVADCEFDDLYETKGGEDVGACDDDDTFMDLSKFDDKPKKKKERQS